MQRSGARRGDDPERSGCLAGRYLLVLLAVDIAKRSPRPLIRHGRVVPPASRSVISPGDRTSADLATSSLSDRIGFLLTLDHPGHRWCWRMAASGIAGPGSCRLLLSARVRTRSGPLGCMHDPEHEENEPESHPHDAECSVHAWPDRQGWRPGRIERTPWPVWIEVLRRTRRERFGTTRGPALVPAIIPEQVRPDDDRRPHDHEQCAEDQKEPGRAIALMAVPGSDQHGPHVIPKPVL